MSGTPEETIGARLRRLRTDRGLSQRELASPGVSYAYISRIEAGTRQPSVKALRKLARKLGVTAEYLETGSDMREDELRELRLAQAELDLRLSDDSGAAYERLRELLTEAEEAGDVVATRRADRGRPRGVPVGPHRRRGRRARAGSRAGRPLADAATRRLRHARPRVRDVRSTRRRGPALRALYRHDRGAAPSDLPARVRFATYLSFALTDLGDLDRAESVLHDVLAEVEASSTCTRRCASTGRSVGSPATRDARRTPSTTFAARSCCWRPRRTPSTSPGRTSPARGR